jgi:hypothetical protein
LNGLAFLAYIPTVTFLDKIRNPISLCNSKKLRAIDRGTSKCPESEKAMEIAVHRKDVEISRYC